MSAPYLIGLVGARGHVGRELIRLIAHHPEMMLAYAVSREFAGRKVAEIAPEDTDECIFEALGPEEAARRRVDAVILALPDGAGEAYLDAIGRDNPDTLIVDLAADHRLDGEWAYGLPELYRSAIAGSKRIANPGCYATAIQLALAPLMPLIDGAPVVFGVSGYSGAGATPNARNDMQRLGDNLIPYGLVGHKHERESSHHLGLAVRFLPHVHPAFRGLIVTGHVALSGPLTAPQIRARFEDIYGGESLIALQDAPPELRDGAGRIGVLIGGFDVGADGKSAVVVAALDNLLKGAAVQAIQNLNIALGLDECMGLGAP